MHRENSNKSHVGEEIQEGFTEEVDMHSGSRTSPCLCAAITILWHLHIYIYSSFPNFYKVRLKLLSMILRT